MTWLVAFGKVTYQKRLKTIEPLLVINLFDLVGRVWEFHISETIKHQCQWLVINYLDLIGRVWKIYMSKTSTQQSKMACYKLI